jgi:dihydroorotate dehydrogenase electron transfer subunit
MSRLEIITNKPIAKAIYRMELGGAAPHRPGQFVMIQIKPGIDPFLRRPFSIMESHRDRLTIIYKVVGHGTGMLSDMPPGTMLDVLEQRGNGFRLDPQAPSVCLIGGGTGIPPLFGLANVLQSMGKTITTVLGFQSREDAFLVTEFSRFGPVHVTTMDGSLGLKGTILKCESEFLSQPYYAVGPLAMLREITAVSENGQISLEERMGCGFGACMGCTIQTRNGPRQVCVDGPVFYAKEIIWDN